MGIEEEELPAAAVGIIRFFGSLELSCMLPYLDDDDDDDEDDCGGIPERLLL